MARYDPERMERSTRDVVARSSYLEIQQGRGTAAGGVLIDISHIGAAQVERQFPGMVERTRRIGRDLATGPVEVSPTAHFHMGGVIINVDCETGVEGLLVAGEDSGGTHGANRLGGNGVAESTVFGARAGDRAALLASSRVPRRPVEAHVQATLERCFEPLRRREGTSVAQLSSELKDVMWKGAGLVRDKDLLLWARDRVQELTDRAARVAVPGPREFNVAWQEALNLVNQLTVARTIIVSALVREESRGAHYRSDFPERDDAGWLRFIVVRRGAQDPDPPSVELRSVALSRRRPEPQTSGRLS